MRTSETKAWPLDEEDAREALEWEAPTLGEVPVDPSDAKGKRADEYSTAPPPFDIALYARASETGFRAAVESGSVPPARESQITLDEEPEPS